MFAIDSGTAYTPRMGPAALGLLCALALLAVAGSAHAGIYKCTVDGAVVFQDRSCADGAEEQLDGAAQPIHDLHPSWFDVPPRLKRNPVCAGETCHCGSMVFPLEKRQDLRLIGALMDLEKLWRNHGHELSRYALLRDPTADDLADIRNSACRVAVSQMVIKSLYKSRSATVDIAQTGREPKPGGKAAASACKTADYTGLEPGLRYANLADCTADTRAADHSTSRRASPMHDALLESLETLRQQRPAY